MNVHVLPAKKSVDLTTAATIQTLAANLRRAGSDVNDVRVRLRDVDGTHRPSESVRDMLSQLRPASIDFHTPLWTPYRRCSLRGDPRYRGTRPHAGR